MEHFNHSASIREYVINELNRQTVFDKNPTPALRPQHDLEIIKIFLSEQPVCDLSTHFINIKEKHLELYGETFNAKITLNNLALDLESYLDSVKNINHVIISLIVDNFEDGAKITFKEMLSDIAFESFYWVQQDKRDCLEFSEIDSQIDYAKYKSEPELWEI